MEIRPVTKEDHLMLCKWWKEHGWQGLPFDHLPKTGYIVNNIVAGFLYKTDSKIALLEFIISDKNSKKEDRDTSLDVLIDKLLDDAKKSEFKFIFSSLEHPKLIERYIKHGFKVTDKNVTNLVRLF